MAGFSVTNGATFTIAKTFGEKINIVSATNANPCVVTVDKAGTLKQGSIVLIENAGWAALEGAHRVLKVEGMAVTLENVNTLNTDVYQAGMGTGTMKEATEFVRLPRIATLNTSGGEAQKTDVRFVDIPDAETISTSKSAIEIAIEYAHDRDQPVNELLESLDLTSETTIIKVFVPKANNETRLAGISVSYQEIPSMGIDEVEKKSLSLSLRGKMRFYGEQVIEVPPEGEDKKAAKK